MYGTLKKKFIKNFLIDKNIQKKIVSFIPKNNSNIIEIGPGDGRLTEFILNFNPKVLKLIEIDKDLIPILITKFSKLKNIQIINEDIIDYRLNEKVDLIISNLPYNISSQILVKICLMRNLPDNLILMFQKEFAERLLDKKLNSLNSLVGCFYDIKSNFNISKNCFRPIPKIDSKVLLFSKKKNLLLRKNEIDDFIDFKRKLFSHKRKTLQNLLKNYDFNKEEYDLTNRIENINLQSLLKIFREINL